MKVLLLQIDGKIPNLALMRISAHHRVLGDDIEFRVAGNFRAIEPHIWDRPDKIYASLIFTRSRPLAERLLQNRPDALVGGSGWDREDIGLVTNLLDAGISTRAADYSIYPKFKDSLGFTQRGCRMTKKTCYFCSVPTREGRNRAEDSILSIYRGDPHPKNLLLLDNDTFGGPNWRNEVAVMRDGGFKVCWNQGINARLLTDEACEAIASLKVCDDQFKIRRIYTAWDSIGDETPLFRGLNSLVRYGMKPDQIMVYMLVGGIGDTPATREYRRAKLRDFGARPYPMPHVVTPELQGFARWVIPAYDKRVPWHLWAANKFRPEGIKMEAA